MILSMTGYGKATAEYNERKIVVEIRSLNSKTMDIQTRIAQLYREKELDIRSTISQALLRGKVDFALYLDNSSTAGSQLINAVVFESYMHQVEDIAARNGIAVPDNWFYTLLRLPDVLGATQSAELTSGEWEAVSNAVNQAIERLCAYRRAEGEALEKKFREKTANITSLLQEVEQFETERVAKIKERIRTSLVENIGVDYDTNRFEQELIYYIEKLDVSEEKQRLQNHLDYFIKTLENGEGQGKKLGFIAQEMGREINTLGSKSNQAEMQNIVVRMKDELEQIKEQVLNVL